MTARVRFSIGLIAAMLAVFLSGCTPSAQGPADEQKEPFFLTGKAREGTLDFKGASEAYEKALEVNPQNASAHFELGLLCEKENDYSAAIYHFERYLKLRPDSERMQIVKDRIMQNKMELAKTTTFAPVTQNMLKDVERLAEENRQLRADNDKLRTDLSVLQTQAQPRQATDSQPPLAAAGGANTPRRPAANSGDQPAPRLYTVKAGDTPSSIARKYNVKVESLLSLNPSLDPKKMQVGQTVKIPAP